MNTHNITIDDALNSTSFVYQPAECSGSGWNVTEGRGYLGTFRLCTTSVGPSVAISFEGVAIYYRSAYIDGGSIRFKLDGALSDDIDLSTPPGQTVNNTATNIFWTRTGLNNTAHLLELLPGSRSNSTLTVDALTVTQINAVNLVNATTAGSTPDASALAGAAAAALEPKQTPSQTRFALGLGIAFGTASFIVFIFICVFLGRRRRQLNKRYSWSKPIPPLRPTSSMYSHHATGHTGTQGFVASPVSSPKMNDDAVMAMRPLPSSVVHGSNEDDIATADTTREWASPVPSNRRLLSQGSSHGHLDNVAPLSRNTTTSTTRLEPVRKGTIS